MRRFAVIEFGDDRIAGKTTILNFRNLLEKHKLTEKLFCAVNAYLADKGVTLRSGTLVDASIIDAPSATKNKTKARDPEMSSTKNGNAFWGVMRKALKDGEMDELDEQINRIIAKVRTKVEHPFRILKRQFSHVKTRYRGLAKNRAHPFTLCELGNLSLMRRNLAA